MIIRQNYHKINIHLQYLADVLQLAPASLERYRFYLRHLLLWADEHDFRDVQILRPTLPAYLAALPGRDGKGFMAGASQKKILDSSKRFFRWTKSTYPREMNGLPAAWIETLRLSRQPRVSSENVFVTVEEIRKLLSIPALEKDLALIRDQAAAAMLFLSGMRASAFTTLPISAVDLGSLTIRQWPELGVHTKNSKKATTFLLNIPELLAPVRRWDVVVRPSLPASSPWYAPIAHSWGDQSLSQNEPGKNRSQALQKRLESLFSLADVEFKSPHKFRHGHAVYGLQHAQTMADYKAVSMNLMHEDIKITDEIYAPLMSNEVKARIERLTSLSIEQTPSQLADSFSHLSNEELANIMVAVAHRLTS